MSRPTEPGYYWLKDDGNWKAVEVDTDGCVLFTGLAWWSDDMVDNYPDDQWGERIVKEPDPPPPF